MATEAVVFSFQHVSSVLRARETRDFNSFEEGVQPVLNNAKGWTRSWAAASAVIFELRMGKSVVGVLL